MSEKNCSLNVNSLNYNTPMKTKFCQKGCFFKAAATSPCLNQSQKNQGLDSQTLRVCYYNQFSNTKSATKEKCEKKDN